MVISKILRSGLLLTILAFSSHAHCQSATISVEQRMIKTYDFSEPNPIPILTDNAKIYPYHKFEGYEQEGKEKEWQMVVLENDYIKVFVLPEVGGKIWGAIEKESGEEFLYRNEVLKFRNIAMRGPWTSGGIEFNFGIIGHTPATATPVDYVTRENSDGSVSCIVGTMDLTSRTQWRVEVNLEPDKAYFTTKSSWHNPTPMNQSYYNWMTGAAVASDDLEFFIPGNQYLEHGGNPNPWPIDAKGRKLSNYKENNFGPHKSYHVVGDYKDYFGGYYHKREFGFGHWAPYEEMPGQKLWLWALSRSGGIWEDLLTDTDGQYIEFQAGRLLNQYFPEGGNNSITQANFEPHVMDRWEEHWFPYKKIGGMEAASEWGVMNVEFTDRGMYVGINALQNLNEKILVTKNDEILYHRDFSLSPMEVLELNLEASKNDRIKIIVGDKKLYYSNKAGETSVRKPYASEMRKQFTESELLNFEASESIKYREYSQAYEGLLKLVKKDGLNIQALVKMAEIEFRQTRYSAALESVKKVLMVDTYHPEANYMAGLIYKELGDEVNALESLGWAARSISFRSAAYAEMATIEFKNNSLRRAAELAQKSLDYNRYNLSALYIQALLLKRRGEEEAFKEGLMKIAMIDPLNHFASYFYKDLGQFKGNSEYTKESALELALIFSDLGLDEDAVKLLSSRVSATKHSLWLAYILRDDAPERSRRLLEDIVKQDIDFVFPYRHETVRVLEWAREEEDHWKLKYYLALNYYAVGRSEEAEALLLECGNTPNSYVFYQFRGQMIKSTNVQKATLDFEKSLELDSSKWKQWESIISLRLEKGDYIGADEMSRRAFLSFPDNYNVGLLRARSLIETGEYAQSIVLLKSLRVLPSELGRVSRVLYYDSHMLLAEKLLTEGKFSEARKLLGELKHWPENLGVGKPYDPDERLVDFMLGLTHSMQGNEMESQRAWGKVVESHQNGQENKSIDFVLVLAALEKLSKNELLNNELERLRSSESEIDHQIISLYEETSEDKKDRKKALLLRLLKF